jgi:hypothetical protein
MDSVVPTPATSPIRLSDSAGTPVMKMARSNSVENSPMMHFASGSKAYGGSARSL